MGLAGAVFDSGGRFRVHYEKNFKKIMFAPCGAKNIRYNYNKVMESNFHYTSSFPLGAPPQGDFFILLV